MYTILIVDDEANLLEVLAVALENMATARSRRKRPRKRWPYSKNGKCISS